jgi:hypothetical protein
VTHSTFISGMSAGCLIAAVVAVVAIVGAHIALPTKKGVNPTEGAAAL